ncbi:hypothetical protein PQX77_014482, partial [Marasmius sp. AFHP31]
MPSSYPGQDFEKMGKELSQPLSFLRTLFLLDAHNHADSDIIYLDVAGTNVVVLNSYKACIDLLDNRSSIYSGRPRLPMVVELMGWDKDFVVLPYGNEWKIRRRLCLQEFPDNGSIRHESEELQVNRVLLKNLLSDPENYRDHLHYMTGSLTILVTYGIDIKSKDDPVLELAATALNALLHALSPGTFAVDALPWLKYVPEWMPGAGFQRKAKQWKELNRRLNHEPFEMVKEQMEKGSARPSFVSNALTRLQEDPEGCGYTEEEVMNTATTMYEGGTDTTWTGLLTFILAMTLHPECQRKAQTEIGRIVGEGRLPDHSDRDALVYVQAVIHEVQRWQPITPTAIVHHVNVEDEYRGYRIQRTQLSSQMSGGFRCPSLVLVTHEGVFVLFRAILHDEEMYPDPYTFNPERWIKDGQIDPDIRDITASFGFGRRICPGRLLALSSLYLTIATILSVFNISKATDENGVAIEPRVEYSSSVQNRPLPFKCSIKPRSEAHERLINELAEH